MLFSQVANEDSDVEDVRSLRGEGSVKDNDARRVQLFRAVNLLVGLGLLSLCLGTACWATSAWKKSSSLLRASLDPEGHRNKVNAGARVLEHLPMGSPDTRPSGTLQAEFTQLDEIQFDCDAEQWNYKKAWTQVKKDYCCEHANFGCTGSKTTGNVSLLIISMVCLCLLLAGIAFTGFYFMTRRKQNQQEAKDTFLALRPVVDNKPENERLCTVGCSVQ